MAAIRETLTLEDKFAGTFTKYLSFVERASASTEMMKDILLNVETATASAAVSMQELSEKLSRTASKSATTESRLEKLGNRLMTVVGAYTSLRGVASLVNLADTYTQTAARLDMMNDGLQDTKELQDMIFQAAQRSRGAYQDTADLVAKLGTLAGSAFDRNAELVAFAEQINKQMTISGTSTVGAQAAMLQLTQAMSSGVLRGEELNSILEQTPTIAQSIANYMGVTVGVMREMASEGKITAEVVKNAMFDAAEETNQKFEDMPMTWSQVWTQAQNIAIQAEQPLLEVINAIANNMDQLAPVVAGVAAGVTVGAAAFGVYKAAVFLADAANRKFIAGLLTNPFTLLAVAVGLIVAGIYKWVQAMGGLKIAWATVVDTLLYFLSQLKGAFYTGLYFVMDLFDNTGLKIQTVAVSVANWMGDMKVNVLTALQNLVNGAIDILNKFISTVNEIPGVSIESIKKVTFASTAAAENEAAKSSREKELAAAKLKVETSIATRADSLASMMSEAETAHQNRLSNIAAMKAENEQIGASENYGVAYDQLQEMESIGDSVKGIEKSVSMSEEDLKSLVDVAERRYVNNINLTSQTPVINITGQNTGNTKEDRQALANAIKTILVEEIASSCIRSTARAF